MALLQGVQELYILKNIVKKKTQQKGRWETVIDEPFQSREFNG